MNFVFPPESHECPSCYVKITLGEKLKNTDKYIKCTCYDCLIGYIPRNRKTQRELRTLLESCETSDYVNCAKCEKSYVPHCVIHTDRFSVCPRCSFQNSYDKDKQLQAERYFTGGSGRYGSYRRCEDCNQYYDNYKYRIFEDSYKDEDEERFICRDCIVAYPTFVHDGDGCGGQPFTLPDVKSYPEIELNSKLHQLSLTYLPEATL
jgi:hypothetical protein